MTDEELIARIRHYLPMRGFLEQMGEEIETLCGRLEQARAENAELRRLAVRRHYYCEDSWYSCPMAEDGCANDAAGTGCNCGAEEHNAKVEAIVNPACKAGGE